MKKSIMTALDLWSRHRQSRSRVAAIGLTLDVSRMRCDDGFLERMTPAMRHALEVMEYSKAATVRKTIADIEAFASGVHSGVIHAPAAPDITDPDGIARTLQGLAGQLDQAVCLITSKSGGTPETRNGMLLAAQAYEAAGLEMASHAVAITMPGSMLDRAAWADGWPPRFPMFDWIGGRTRELSAVGLLPAALQGRDIDGLLAGASACDEATRPHHTRRNPAALMALSWYHATSGKELRDMVVLACKDRLLLLSRYLQQLITESSANAWTCRADVSIKA